MSTQTITIILIVLVLLVAVLIWRIKVLSRQVQDLRFRKKSGEVLHGKAWENFAPFMDAYPYDPSRFRFIGYPIDGLSFEDDKIVFIEFKTGMSKLSERQKQVRDLVARQRVEWLEIRQ